jgi:hypothetical protein
MRPVTTGETAITVALDGERRLQEARKMASFPLRRNSDFEQPAPEPAQRLQPSQMLNVPLGTLIYRAGLLSQEDVQGALTESIRTEKMLGEVLLERGMVEERELGRLLAGQKGLPFVELDRIQIDDDVARRLPEEAARAHSALPLAVDPNGTPLVAVVNPDASVVEAIANALGVEPHVGVAARGELLRAIDSVHAAEEESAEVTEEVAEQSALRLAGIEGGEVAEDETVTVPVVGEATESWQTDVQAETDGESDAESDLELPTASTAEAEAFDEESADDDEPSDSSDSDDSPSFAWGGYGDDSLRTLKGEAVEEEIEEQSLESAFDSTTDGEVVEGGFDEPSESVVEEQSFEDQSFVGGEEPVLALVSVGEQEESEAPTPFGETLVAFPTSETETESEHEVVDGVTDLQLEPESTVEEASSEGEPVGVEHDDEPAWLESAEESDAAAVSGLQVETESIDDEVKLEAEAPILEHDDEELPVAEVVDSELAAEVFITLSNGERLSTGRFAKTGEASSHALSLLADIKRNWWPQVDGRLIRPDAVLSIDIEQVDAK